MSVTAKVTTTFQLEPALAKKLSSVARRENVSKVTIVNNALRAYLEICQKKSLPAK